MMRNLGCKGCVRLLYEVPQADLVLDKLAGPEVFFYLGIEGKGDGGENNMNKNLFLKVVRIFLQFLDHMLFPRVVPAAIKNVEKSKQKCFRITKKRKRSPQLNIL